MNKCRQLLARGDPVSSSTAQRVGRAPASMTFTAAWTGLSYQSISVHPNPGTSPYLGTRHMQRVRGVGNLHLSGTRYQSENHPSAV